MDVPVKHFLMTKLNLTRSYGPGPVLIAVFRLAILLILVSAGTFTLLSFSPVDPIRAYIGNDLLHVPPPTVPPHCRTLGTGPTAVATLLALVFASHPGRSRIFNDL